MTSASWERPDSKTTNHCAQHVFHSFTQLREPDEARQKNSGPGRFAHEFLLRLFVDDECVQLCVFVIACQSRN